MSVEIIWQPTETKRVSADLQAFKLEKMMTITPLPKKSHQSFCFFVLPIPAHLLPKSKQWLEISHPVIHVLVSFESQPSNDPWPRRSTFVTRCLVVQPDQLWTPRSVGVADALVPGAIPRKGGSCRLTLEETNRLGPPNPAVPNRPRCSKWKPWETKSRPLEVGRWEPISEPV